MTLRSHQPSSAQRHLCGLVRAIAFCGAFLTCSTAFSQVTTQSPEIVFSGPDAKALRDKAAQLGDAASIYEYVHNNIEYSPYHGSRSGSVNTFLGRRGSDVDIATTLIAMLRSQRIPARYAVGTVRLPSTELTNWLGVPHLDTAIEILKSQGIQGVSLSSDRKTVDMEHAWAEAFVPFDQYRGVNVVTPAIDCSLGTNFGRCTWVPLDASFKRRAGNGITLDPHNALSFDYTAYFNAIKNNDSARRDKNPLTILEDQIGVWLRTNHPGKTLEDVEDAGRIVEIREGLLPASLPFQVVGAIRRYDTVAAHDAAPVSTEPKRWGKTVRVGVKLVAGGVSIQAGGTPLLLAEVNTKRLTMTTEFIPPGNLPNMVVRLGGVEVSRPIGGNGTIGNFVPAVGYPFTLTVTMDGAPSVVAGEADRTISAEYSAIIGGYYLVATGGESSNWSQVHRAADQLLTANSQHKIVFNPSEAGCQAGGVNCTPYVDATGNGWDSSDRKLLEDKNALDALTGGLLYVGATQYYAKLREHFERADRLMKARTPIIGFLGVVSSVYEAEYVDGTAFSILPGGLLIDMKGITIGGSYRVSEQSLTYSNRQFEFLGHIASSLEHEIWQELTGYDAVSTVRGIQMALGTGATLVNAKRNSSANTVGAFLTAVGFGATAPSPFAIAQRDIYGTRPTTWSHTTSTGTIGFEALKRTPVTGDTRLPLLSYYNDLWHAAIGCHDTMENQLISLRNSYGGAYKLTAGGGCGVNWTAGTTVDTANSMMKASYDNLRGGANAEFFNYLDVRQGFVTADFGFRTLSPTANAYSTYFIVGIRNDLQLRDITQTWVEYTLPSTLVTGATYRFEVNIRKGYTASDNRLTSLSFEIANRSFTAGGGYVGGQRIDEESN